MKHSPTLLRSALFCCAALAACKDDAPYLPVAETAGIVRVKDLNDLPNVVEVQLIASATDRQYLKSGSAQVWAYRDGANVDSKAHVPGPLIEANQGDRVIVHFRNELPEGTTIHWHGLRVPNGSDGTPSTQVEVPPGGEFRYEFVARDEGTFWYHPHVRGDTQVERGLYGMLVVHGGPRVPVSVERALVLDDVKLTATGALSNSTTSLDIMLGRLGNHVLANGIVDSVLPVENGSRERWRIVNTANGRYFNLRLPGHAFQVIGWDGGLLPAPYVSENLLIAPGERYDVLVELRGAVGSEVALETIHYDRGHNVPDPGPQAVLRLRFQGELSTALAPLPPVWGAPVTLMPVPGASEKMLELDEKSINDGADTLFTINDKAFPDGLMLEGREGDVEVWNVHNKSEMDHPFHLHGMFFRVLDVNGVAPVHDGWKDTANVPKEATLRFVVQYGDPGRWMFHCHVLEHAERGMMGDLGIRPRDASSVQTDAGGSDGGGTDADSSAASNSASMDAAVDDAARPALAASQDGATDGAGGSLPDAGSSTGSEAGSSGNDAAADDTGSDAVPLSSSLPARSARTRC